MLPIFPEFRELTANDKSYIEKHTDIYEPYSDFTFANLWIWDIHNRYQISTLNQNLIVMFYDYTTDEYFLSFLGKNKIDDTLSQLFAYAEKNKLKHTLNFVPEAMIQHIDQTVYKCIEDLDDFDYIYSVPKIALLNGNEYKSKRLLVHQFQKMFPTRELKIEDINDSTVQEKLFTLIQSSRENKQDNQKAYYFEFEKKAFEKLLYLARQQSFILFCLYEGDSLIGFCVEEIVQKKYSLSHFLIVNNRFRGAYDFLNMSTAQYLEMNGVELWNWAEDLGIDNLRKAKLAYRPVTFLKKYQIRKL